jgi:basic membrane protein A
MTGCVQRRAMKRVAIVAVGLLASIGLAACGDNGGSSAGGSEPKQPGASKVGLSTIGPRNDRSFSQEHYQGALRAAKEVPGVTFTGVVENADTPQGRIDAFKNLAPTNDLILGGSAGFADAAPAVARLYPKKHFVVSTGATKEKFDNVTSLVPDEGLAAVPAGAVMAKLSQTKRIGFVGGAEIPPTVQSLAAVKAGAGSVDPGVKVSSTIVGDFNDVAKAKAATEALISAGADQVFAFLDAGIEGVYQAAAGKDIGVYQIISLRCQEYKNVVGSAIENAAQLMVDAVKQFKDGTLKPGAVFYGLTSPDYLRFDLCPKYEGQAEIAALAKKTTEDVNSGALKLPAAVKNARPDYPVTEK